MKDRDQDDGTFRARVDAARLSARAVDAHLEALERALRKAATAREETLEMWVVIAVTDTKVYLEAAGCDCAVCRTAVSEIVVDLVGAQPVAGAATSPH